MSDAPFPQLSQLTDGPHQFPNYITTENDKAIQKRLANYFTNYHLVSHFVTSPLPNELPLKPVQVERVAPFTDHTEQRRFISLSWLLAFKQILNSVQV
jgi:hypothetical protein